MTKRYIVIVESIILFIILLGILPNSKVSASEDNSVVLAACDLKNIDNDVILCLIENGAKRNGVDEVHLVNSLIGEMNLSKKIENKMTKDTVPEGFSVSLALMDMIPVIFFGLSAIRIGRLLKSKLFQLGAVICLGSGVVKVLWKIIAAVLQKNIWPMFVQMRILMPVGFLLLIVALIIGHKKLNGPAILKGFTSFPSCIFFAVAVIGMLLMAVFAYQLDSSDIRVNWLEQSVNATAQICFFIGVMMVKRIGKTKKK